MNDVTIGRCSLCGGNVTVPKFWGGVVPPTPCCASCRATAKAPEMPTIPMERPVPRVPHPLQRHADGLRW